MRPFTVIGYYEECGQIFCDHVEAETVGGAFAVTASTRSDAELVCALPGHLQESEHIAFPGLGVVSAATVLEKPEVFC